MRPVALLLLLVALAAPAARAQDDTIEACVRFPRGTVRIVTDEAECKRGETRVEWAARVELAPRFQLVGFTNATFAGDGGVLGMSAACAAEFPASRMCDSREVIETTAVPDLTGRPRAWVRPIIVFGTGNSVTDASGFTASGYLDVACFGWTSEVAELVGLTVSAQGGFVAERSVARGSCDVARPVACCAAVP